MALATLASLNSERMGILRLTLQMKKRRLREAK